MKPLLKQSQTNTSGTVVRTEALKSFKSNQ